jgi:hypothetical protein
LLSTSPATWTAVFLDTVRALLFTIDLSGSTLGRAAKI